MPAPKYQQVYDALSREIRSGRWKEGDRLPSEALLSDRFRASRITVGRAVKDLQLAGLVERRAGSGTYIRAARPAGALSFGLLIPDLGETEIFEPICQGMMASPLARRHALVQGSLSGVAGSKAERAWDLCRQYIDRRVAGVFFAPLELAPAVDEVNQRIGRALDEARIPVVLLDRTIAAYPERGHHDLVGIDNRQAGHVVTEHLLRLGARRIAFVARPHAAATIETRQSGYRDALYRWGVEIDRGLVALLDPADRDAVAALVDGGRPDAIVCANDGIAARLMRTLLELGRRVPEDVRLVGIDDVGYAGLLPVPLTTLRQPTREIGAVALSAMLDRLGQPELPTRDVLLHGELIVRKSCGALSPTP
jgi:DNA-binding LacI/PurR family transcriptional regulator